MGACDPGFSDCNHNDGDGCEHDGVCVCAPGQLESCYHGPSGTVGVGACAAGIRTCNPDGLGYGSCDGQIIPVFEGCEANGDDSDCNGIDDDGLLDQDGDGWTPCDGDCCDTAEQCLEPTRVNPGAYDFPGNAVNDDCNGDLDDPTSGCDQGVVSNTSEPLDFADVLDLCQSAAETASLETRRWGVISAALTLVDNTGSPAPNSHAVRARFGAGIVPAAGQALAVLSTGHAAATGQVDPSFAAFQDGANMGTTSALPADWLAANNGSLPAVSGCPTPDADEPANDPVMLVLRLRVPTNARSFSLDVFFLSSEFPEWICSPYNDYFVALLDSNFLPGISESPNPADKNLAVHGNGLGDFLPVGANLAHDGVGPFVACRNGATGCESGATPGVANGCTSTNALIDTGFDTLASANCYPGEQVGGGTGWLRLSGNVVPGEIITLRLALWDTADHLYDSVVLLDHFQWSTDLTLPGVVSR